MGSFGIKSRAVFFAILAIVAVSACSPHRDPDKKTLAQESEGMDSTGFHLCRMNYSYTISGTEEPLAGYIALAGMDRDELRRKILEECVKLPADKAAGCSKPGLIKDLACSHVDAIAKFAVSDNKDLAPGSVYQCSASSSWRFAGQAYDQFSTFIMKNGDTKSAAVQAMIDACMVLPDLERDGCSLALVRADLRCIQTPEGF